MPQIFVIVAPGTEKRLQKDALGYFEKSIAKATEKLFGIEGENDVAITRVNAIKTANEADIQVEVRYTAGKDEYNRGEPFDPPIEKIKELASLIISLARVGWIEDDIDISAWVKPIYGSAFKTTL